jgi:transposase
MPRKAPEIVLNAEQRAGLSKLSRSQTVERRMAVRAQITLFAADGLQDKQIAAQMGLSAQTVAKWRSRFQSGGLAGLSDRDRPGKPATYSEQTNRRILAKLDEPPPKGYTSWTGSLIAQALADVSDQQVWRVLRAHGIHARRRRSWCVSTDPEFAAKAADIVGLYLNPPNNAIVVCVDEKPGIQALERRQGYLKYPDGRAITGYAHEYKRHGTTTLIAALETATGMVKANHYNRRRRIEFLDFMNDLTAQYPQDQELHVILDNLSTHKPKEDKWLAQHPNVFFHFTPTHASWLNQIEIWFSVLWQRVLRGASFLAAKALRQAIDDYIAASNAHPAPFHWNKAQVGQKQLRINYAD